MDIDFKELAETVKREDVKLVMFSNPCNPTGVLESRADVLKFVSETDAIVIADEAYMEFARDGGASVIDEVESYDNLIVLKTVSKYKRKNVFAFHKIFLYIVGIKVNNLVAV